MTRKSTKIPSKVIDTPRDPNLKFLKEFMATCGDSAAEIARMVGLTRAGVSHWFIHDDCKLSYCENYINSKGYDLAIELKGATVSPDGMVSINIVKEPLAPEDAGCRRVRFLQTALAKQGISKVRVAKDLGMKANSVRHWFAVDDIYVSYIFKIAELYGLKVCIDIKPKVRDLCSEA